MDFGTRLRTLRRELDYTQEELANLFNIRFHTAFNKSTISQYENGKRLPDVELLKNWADFFGVSTDYLLGRTDKKDNITTIAAHRTYGNNSDIKNIDGLKDLIRQVINEEKNK